MLDNITLEEQRRRDALTVDTAQHIAYAMLAQGDLLRAIAQLNSNNHDGLWIGRIGELTQIARDLAGQCQQLGAAIVDRYNDDIPF